METRGLLQATYQAINARTSTRSCVRKLRAALIEAFAGRVVYLSATPAADPPGGLSRAVEELIEVSGLEWTHLRPTGFVMSATSGYRQRPRASM